jgi:leucyl-tRNA synthetase
MPEQNQNFTEALSYEINSRVADVEEKQRLLRDRVVLISKNLIEFREDSEKLLQEIKSTLSQLTQDVEKLKTRFFKLSEDLEKKAKKTEVEIIKKQLKMLEPLSFLNKNDN